MGNNATEKLEKITEAAKMEGATEDEFRKFILGLQRSTTQDITKLLNIRLKLQENYEKTKEMTNWY